MRTTDLRRGLVALSFAPLLFAACGGTTPPPDPGPPPAPTEPEIGVTASPTAAAVPSAEPTATVATPEPTSTPVATAEPTAAPTAAPVAAAPALAEPAGANLHVGSMTVDGLTLQDVACHADGLGLLGSMIVVGSIAKKKAALDACGKGKTRIEWAASKGSVSKATAKGDNAKMDACVAKVLKGAVAPFEGECAATLVTGK